MLIREAKKAFFKYDGSLFSMAREEQEIYEKFRRLNIPEKKLEKWRLEIIHSKFQELKITGSHNLFNRMEYLVEGKQNLNYLRITRNALYMIRFNNLEEKACICETLIGRLDISQRSGMIFWAYDIGAPEIAKELLQYVYQHANVETSDERLRTRFDDIIKNCHTISSILNIQI